MTRLLYTAEATVAGDRKGGHGRSADGALDVQLRVPPELGGEGGGTNPEQLFAVGYAACFASALETSARRKRVELGEPVIASSVALVALPDRTFTIAVTLDVTLSALTDDQARELVAAAHAICPYSNATRDNIEVELVANGRPVA